MDFSNSRFDSEASFSGKALSIPEIDHAQISEIDHAHISVISFSAGSEIARAPLPGAPDNIDMEFGDFDTVTLVMNGRCGKVSQSSGEEACLLLETSFPAMMCQGADFASIRINAVAHPKFINGRASLAKYVPLSWVNRVVLVQLEFGNVMGILSDESIRECAHLYFTPLPGAPAIPPLPIRKIYNAFLVPKVMHASVHLSLDAQVEVHKYLIQTGENIWLREVQVIANSAFKEDILFWRYTSGQEACKYQMEYQRYQERDGYVQASFYRFPEVRDRDDHAAENEDWRLRWADMNIHLAGTPVDECYYAEFHEAYAEFLGEEFLANLHSNEDYHPSSLDNIRFYLWREQHSKVALNI